jgi:aromatic ring hydroxylase
MVHIVREDDNGIVIRGARMLATIDREPYKAAVAAFFDCA